MFNFESTHLFTGPDRVCIQMDDSEWSTSFSLDNLEITQTVAADHAIKGALELGYVNSVMIFVCVCIIIFLHKWIIIVFDFKYADMCLLMYK